MTEDIYTVIGKRIREERQKANLTQEELGEKADIHYSFLGYIERGAKKASIRTINKISVALGVPVSKIFESIELKPKKTGYSMANKFDFFLKDRPRKEQEIIFNILKNMIRSMDKKLK